MVTASLLGRDIELKKTKGKWEDISSAYRHFRKPKPEEIPK
jgi:hypothetical protein